MNAFDYEILNIIYNNPGLSQRAISTISGFSLGKVNKCIRGMQHNGYLDECFKPTALSLSFIESVKPTSAIILAAGCGLRMIPLCRDIPKALLEIKGEVLIERLICQLHDVGITNIHIVVGYMKEKFEYLIDKYNVNLIVNSHFENRNNLYSLYLASDYIHNSYIVPCDIYCYDNPFRHTETYSWYMVTNKKIPTSCLAINRNQELITPTATNIGNQEIGIAYLAKEQAAYIKSRLAELQTPDNYHLFWEHAAIADKKSVLHARLVDTNAVREINTYDDLTACDAYSNSLNSEYIDIICKSLHVKREDISHITAQKAGMTNRSFLFCCNEQKYIFRIPGEGTSQLINRRQEFSVYKKIQNKNLCDDIIYINSDSGYKITRFIDNANTCNPENPREVEACMHFLRRFHEMNISVEHDFDIFKQIDYYEQLRGSHSVYEDYDKTKSNVLQLKEYIDNQKKDYCLCHIDSVCDNFIFSNEQIYLIDWEYAGMQDPHVDIAMFAIYALYDKDHVDKLIDYYFDNNCKKQTRLKIYCYIAACGLLWSNWCEYKACFGETFGEYSLRQYRYAKEFYQHFEKHVIDTTCGQAITSKD